MQTSTCILVCNIALVLVAVAGLCLTSSVFDFIVLSKKYYTMPDHAIIIDPLMRFLLYPSFAISFLISFLSLIFLSSGPKIIKFAIDHQFALSGVHLLFLCAASVYSAYVSFVSAQLAHEVSVYAEISSPTEFQNASIWYFSRLRAIMVISIIQSILNGIVVSVLYLGISCKYRTFVELSEKPVQPDLVERTTYFA